jgi:DNA polymerase elongation subunit (family B)
MDKIKVLSEIKSFLEGYNNDLKYIVNVEGDPGVNYCECVIAEPNKPPRVQKIQYEPFVYIRDLKKYDRELYKFSSKEFIDSKRKKHGITVTKLETGGFRRLINGYLYRVSSSKSFNDIITYFRDGGVDLYQKAVDEDGNLIRNAKGDITYSNRELFFSLKITEQFLISTQSRLYKGFEEYKQITKLTFDIETTGLRYEICRVFAIGVRTNRNFETILEVEKENDDDAEAKLILEFLNLIRYLEPAIVLGHNIEWFDFDFILGRAKILKLDVSDVIISNFRPTARIKRRGNVSVKYGSTADRYTATEIWGVSVIDTIHAAKKTAAVNTEIKSSGLKYLAKHEKIARENRIYISGEDDGIGKYYNENKLFLIDNKNTYIEIPDEYQGISNKLYNLQKIKTKVSDVDYNTQKVILIKENPLFIKWYKENALNKGLINFIGGKDLVKRYLLDDLYETEQIDELYNQSSFMLAKIVPTTYQKICTMGTAAIWNLLMIAWSYENNIAIPESDVVENFPGGLARCFKTGYSERIIKIDYASLYPSIQLTEDVFPIFDITSVLKKMLLYLTTTRNIYKKMGNGDKLNNNEVVLLKEIDPEIYDRYLNNSLTATDISMFKIKQLPIKILNNSLYGALGSNISFNWSDNICANRITCAGRLHLRHAINWFSRYNCVALLAVTDGVNFNYPVKTKIKFENDNETIESNEDLIENMWKYDDKVGMSALIEKFNKEIERFNISLGKENYISVDDDGKSVSCLNLSRINYATLSLKTDKKTGEEKEKVKLVGNTVKSKTMPEYIEEFIDNGLDLILHGKGKEFVDYYYNYVENIRYMQIPLKKIASKSKVKTTIAAYKKRGKDKNGRDKGMQAYMELLIEQRELIAEELFEKHKDSLDLSKVKKELTINDKMKLISDYMPPEPELDTVVYYINISNKKSHGDSHKIKDRETGKERYCSALISKEDLLNNPDMKGTYNYEKYLDAFNKRVELILAGFDPEIRKKILVKIDKKGEIKKELFTNEQLELKNFDSDLFHESMHLEEKEVLFWNRTGYNPKLIWDGFMTYDDSEHQIYYEIYENALNYLNGLMEKSNKPKIKSINEKHEKNDLILLKNYDNYMIGVFNGNYVQIIRENVEVPKSDIEIELENKKIKKIKELEVSGLKNKSEDEISLQKQNEKYEKYFPLFKKKYNINDSITFDMMIGQIDDFIKIFDIFVSESELEVENENLKYQNAD